MAPPERTAGRPPWRSSASLRRQILGLLAALVLLVLAGSVAAILLLVRQTEQEDWRGRQAEATRRVAEAVGDFVSRQQNLLQVLDSPGRDELMRGDTELDSLLRRQPALLDLVYLRHDGEVLAAAPAGATVLANLFTIVQSKWFLAARGGEDYIGDVQMSFAEEPYLIIALPAADRAVIAARLRMDVLSQVIASLHFGRTGIAYVVNRQGRVIAHSDPQAVRDHVRLNEGSPLLSAARSGDSPVAGEYLNFAGESVVGTLLRIPGTPWVAVTELSWAEAYAASLRALVISVAAAVLFSAVLFIVGSALLERRLLRPLRHLHQGVARIGEGDLGHRIDAGGPGEIGSLAEAFNGMALRLQDRDRELARHNEALEQSEARYRAIVEDQSELICRFAPDGRLTFVNDAFCRYFGRSREDLLDHRFDPLVPEEDQRRRQRHLAQLHPHGPVANIEHRAILAGGEVRWQQWTDRAIFDASGQLMEYASVGRDITERRSAEEELRNRSAQEGLLIALALRFINIHEGALDSGIDLVLAEVGRFVGADRAYQFRYDFPRDIMINTHEWCAEGITAEKDHLQAVPNDQLPSWVEAHRRGEPVQIPDLGAMPPDDSVRAILEPQGIKSLIVIPLRYGEECIGFVGFDAVRQHRSWTGTEVALLQILAELLVNAELKRRHELGIAEARRKLEESSLRANEMAQTAAAASQAKSRFLATMSHEIRTPMNGVLGMTELLLETPLDARQRHYATVLRESGEALLAIIDDVLDVSKIEAGRMEIERIAFDPRRLTERVLELLRPRAQAKGLAVALRVAAEVPPVLLGDPVRIRQILVNLLGNAIKFTERGGVEVELTARPLADREDGCLLRLRVTDSGIGIAAEVLPRLFQPFAQADNSTTRRFGGSGLGLAIVRQIVELMGGRVGVESEAGRGSVFWVEVPLVGVSQVATPQAAAPGRVAASPTGSVRVLVVDDCESNREILLHRLHKAGMSADGVGDGQAALGLLVQAAGAGEPYRLAFLERRLPDMTGVELARRIQALPSLADLSLILVDNQAEPGQWREAQAAGMVATIEKPVSQDGLSRCLDQVLGVQAPVGGRGAGPGLGARVLLVDDNAMNLVLAEAHLANLGYQVTLAGDGASALAAAADGGFDLIFMDCCMPVMDGFEATRRLRASEAGGRRTPVIAMTANALPSDRDDCMAAGMDDFLPKPYSKAELVAVLERWAPRRAAPAAGAPPPGAAAATAGETGVGGDDSNLPEVLDPTTLQRLIAEHRGGVALLGRLLGLFWEDGGKQLAQIERALAEGDDETLVRAAHTLKSSSATLGAGRLAEIARQIERAARAGQRAGLAERAAAARCAFDAARAAQARFLAEAGA